MSNKQKVRKTKKLNGFTIIELVIAVVVCTTALMGIGFVTVESQRSWTRTYTSIFSDVTTQSQVAKICFVSVIRKAQKNTLVINNAGNSIKVSYYSSSAVGKADCYARLYAADGDLYVEYGTLDPKQTTCTNTLCNNVHSCRFQQIGTSVQMIFTLNNGRQATTVATSAVMHN